MPSRLFDRNRNEGTDMFGMRVESIPVSTVNEGPRKSKVKDMRLARIETQRPTPL